MARVELDMAHAEPEIGRAEHEIGCRFSFALGCLTNSYIVPPHRRRARIDYVWPGQRACHGGKMVAVIWP
jgi:hypothetical protein